MAKLSTEKVLNNVLKKIVPKASEKRRMETLASTVLSKTNSEASKYNATAMIAGSLTRDTWLTGKMEFDIFITFPKTMPKKELERAGLEIGKTVISSMGGTYFIDYAEHPYVSGDIRGVTIDIVPCYKLSSTKELKSSVDRTPFHVRYIEKGLEKRLSNDVRLLKKLCVAHDLYGADTKTEGFSGYVCELLIIKYGSFVKTLEYISKWNYGEVLDLKGFYKPEEHQKLRKEFKNQPLILIDPTDMKRNTAAAVSERNFQRLRTLANQVLKTPSEKLFFPEKKKALSLNDFRKIHKLRDSSIILVKFTPPKVVPDILWPQLRRFSNRLEVILKENEFSVLRKDVYSDGKTLACILLEMETDKLPGVQKRVGPHISDESGSKNFIKKYKDLAINGPFVENGFWVVETKRKFRTSEEKLKDSLGDKLKELKAKGIPSHIAEEISKNYNLISEPENIFKISKKDEGFGIFLRNYFEKDDLNL